MISWWRWRFQASQALHPLVASVTLCPNSHTAEFSKNLPIRSSSATRISIFGPWKHPDLHKAYHSSQSPVVSDNVRPFLMDGVSAGPVNPPLAADSIVR